MFILVHRIWQEFELQRRRDHQDWDIAPRAGDPVGVRVYPIPHGQQGLAAPLALILALSLILVLTPVLTPALTLALSNGHNLVHRVSCHSTVQIFEISRIHIPTHTTSIRTHIHTLVFN